MQLSEAARSSYTPFMFVYTFCIFQSWSLCVM